MTLSTDQQAALSRLFSPAVYREMGKLGQSSTFARLFEAIGLVSMPSEHATVADGFDSAFAALRKGGLRDEYVYRSAIIHNVLLGKHSLRTASMLSEFRAGSCKADVVILNGTSTVYEIKSERDTLTRLVNQIENYSRVFASINVIVSEPQTTAVLKVVPEHVGIMYLSHKNDVEIFRDAVDQPDRVHSVSIFETMRTAEAVAALKEMGEEVPKVNNIAIHSAMREIFEVLSPERVHRAMVSVLKRTRSCAPMQDFLTKLPVSLHAAALSANLSKKAHGQITNAINTPLIDALKWT